MMRSCVKTFLLLLLSPAGQAVLPTLHGPGFDCEPAFAEELNNLSLDSVLLCNKTSSGPGFKKTEIQALNSRVKRLESGECDQLSGEGFTCVEHYECIGEDVTLATTGDSSTQIISILTEVNVEQQLPSYTYNYAFSILDATDKTCQTYTKVCCGPRDRPKRGLDSQSGTNCAKAADVVDLKDSIEVCETDPTPPPPKPSSTAKPDKKCVKAADVVDLKDSDGIEVCETDPSSPPPKPSSTAKPRKKCVKTADIIILKDVDYSYDESEEEECETDPTPPPPKPSSTAKPKKKCVKTADVIILKDVDHSYDESEDEECETDPDSSPSPTPPASPSPVPSVLEKLRCRTLRELIDLKDLEEDDNDNEECKVESQDTTITVKPAITKPGKEQAKAKCKTLKNVVTVYDVFSEETFPEEDEECHISIESDSDRTTINMKPGQSSEPNLGQEDEEILNEVDNPCDSYPDIDPKLSKLVTLYDSLEDDCYSAPTQTPPVVVPPEVPADFVPRCGRHNEEGYLQSITKMDPDQHETQFGEWPGMCAILLDGEYIAGASLVSPRMVMTAAHRVAGKRESSVSVRCGDWDTRSQTELFPHQDRTAARIIIHHRYVHKGGAGNLKHDIALVEVSSPFSLAPHLDTVCLPSPGQTFTHHTCAATGWGKKRFGDEAKLQVILKEVWMKVVDHGECQNLLRKTKLGRFFTLDREAFICAGGQKDVDMCTGDGGSPLMCRNMDGSFTQAGIVAWGIECNLEDVPGGYVNVASYVCWIKQKVEEVEGENYLPDYEECRIEE